jgi:hypothetical protein
MRFTELLPIRSQEEFLRLQEEAKKDNHIPLGASHYFRRDGQITGFAGLDNQIPCVHLWSHTQRMSAADSFSMLNAIENYNRLLGKTGIIIPQHAGSAFEGHLERVGYTKVFNSFIYMKSLL